MYCWMRVYYSTVYKNIHTIYLYRETFFIFSLALQKTSLMDGLIENLEKTNFFLHLHCMSFWNMLYSIKPLPSPPPPPPLTFWPQLSCCLCVRGVSNTYLKTTLSNNYRIIDFPYRSNILFAYRIIDSSIIEPACPRKLSIHRYRSMK